MKRPFRSAPPRLDKAAALPLVLAFALAAAACLQLLVADQDDLPPGGAATGGRSAAAPPPDAPHVPVSPIILARSLFAPGARSPAGDAAPADPLGGITVAGSIRRGGAAYAIVTRPGRPSVSVPLGGRIAGWYLRGLSGTAALLVRGKERLNVPFGTQPVTGPAQAPGSGDQ